MYIMLFLACFAFLISLLLAWIFYLMEKKDEQIKEIEEELIKKNQLIKELDKKNQLTQIKEADRAKLSYRTFITLDEITKPNSKPLIKNIDNIININDYRKK
jgi:hypothetical protein